jgi:hypothetical protein
MNQEARKAGNADKNEFVTANRDHQHPSRVRSPSQRFFKTAKEKFLRSCFP